MHHRPSTISRRTFLQTTAGGLLLSSAACRDRDFDLLIRGGTIVDGTGGTPFQGDVGVRAGRIAALGDLSDAAAGRVIDAAGLTVAPGFIDIHNHSDDSLIAEPLCESMVRQGVTTMVLGEGNSAGPVREGEQDWTTLGEYFEFVEQRGVAPNICSYVGQGQVWTYVKGFQQQPATPEEIADMQELVDGAMRDGALGLSTSLLMPPASLVTREQLAQLASVARRHGGIYSTHIRDEGRGVFDSVAEAIYVGREAGIPVDIIHLKIAHKDLWGRMDEVVAMIGAAREEGLRVTANVYPYTAGQNNLNSIIPPWAHDGGTEEMLERLRTPDHRTRIRTEVLEGLPDWYNHYLATGDGWDGILLVSMSHPNNRPFEGRRMGELIRARGGGDPVDALMDVLLEEEGSVPAVFFHHSEGDMQLALRQPFTSVGSDGRAVSTDGETGAGHPHPRYYGAFPRVLGRYVRELNVLSLPDAVRKMTSMNAEKIGLRERGVLREGYHADVTLFDADRVEDRATFQDPHQYADGIEYVLVNGRPILEEGSRSSDLPGRVLRGELTTLPA
jgi:N-acyl-D-aspartate/D-glutamate deacylase